MATLYFSSAALRHKYCLFTCILYPFSAILSGIAISINEPFLFNQPLGSTESNTAVFVFSLYWLLCLVSTINLFLYESYFVINERGFGYGKQKRFSKKAIVKDIDYNWHQIKEIYFETTTTLHTSISMIVVKKNGVKNTIGLSLLPISKKELKFLIIKYSKRNDIFRN